MFKKMFKFQSLRFTVFLIGVCLIIVSYVPTLIVAPRCYVRSSDGGEDFVIIRTWIKPCITDIHTSELIDTPYLYAGVAHFLGKVLITIGWIFMLAKIISSFAERKQIENYGINFIGFLIITLLFFAFVTGSLVFGILTPPDLGERL